MADARFNCIAIFDAIPNGELNTARRLKDELLDVRLTVPARIRLEIRYFRIEKITDLEVAFESLMADAETTGLIPWLHLEGHGLSDETGFVAANGTPCTWIRLNELVTPLNVTTRLNVVILLATCFGGSFARSIRIDAQAPVLALVGPPHEITAGQSENDFKNPYKAFFVNNSIKEALEALERNGTRYVVLTAKNFFLSVWRGYKRDYCSDKKLEERARNLAERAKAGGHRRVSMGHFRRSLREATLGTFAKSRDRYFMYDLYLDHRERFTLSFEEAEAFARRRRT